MPWPSQNKLENSITTKSIQFYTRHSTKDHINSVDNATTYDASTKLIDNQWGYSRHEPGSPLNM